MANETNEQLLEQLVSSVQNDDGAFDISQKEDHKEKEDYKENIIRNLIENQRYKNRIDICNSINSIDNRHILQYPLIDLLLATDDEIIGKLEENSFLEAIFFSEKNLSENLYYHQQHSQANEVTYNFKELIRLFIGEKRLETIQGKLSQTASQNNNTTVQANLSTNSTKNIQKTLSHPLPASQHNNQHPRKMSGLSLYNRTNQASTYFQTKPNNKDYKLLGAIGFTFLVSAGAGLFMGSLACLLIPEKCLSFGLFLAGFSLSISCLAAATYMLYNDAKKQEVPCINLNL